MSKPEFDKPKDYVEIFKEPDGSYRRVVTGNPPTMLSNRQFGFLLDLLIRKIDREEREKAEQQAAGEQAAGQRKAKKKRPRKTGGS